MIKKFICLMLLSFCVSCSTNSSNSNNDKNKNIRGVYNGTLALESKQIVEDIKTLL